MNRLIGLMESILMFVLLSFIAVGFKVFAEAVVPPTYLDGLTSWISQQDPKVVVGASGMFIELVLRAVTTSRAISLLVPFKYLVDGLVIILEFVSLAIGAMITTLNNVSQPKT